ncbi:hypothetical protein BJ165DRAFT_1528389 [Panaeolus papilionaceus]|nr:hypothetical protein BJ165DRAFT_1528389 [Panaeolus papilionaceus]
MSTRWTQDQDDSTRLPDGFKRVAYDADTQQYTFKDRNGQLYKGEPGADYGTLTPIGPLSSLEQTRPSAFATSHSRSQSLPYPPGAPPKTFQDILAPEFMTTSSLSEQPSSRLGGEGANGKAREQLISAVKKSTLPKMQHVVHSLRRSMTSVKKNSRPSIPSVHRRRGFEMLDDPEVDDQEGLLRRSTLRESNSKPSDIRSTVGGKGHHDINSSPS